MIVMVRAHAFNGFGGPVHSLNFILGVPALGLRQSGRRCRRRAPLPKGRRRTGLRGEAGENSNFVKRDVSSVPGASTVSSTFSLSLTLSPIGALTLPRGG